MKGKILSLLSVFAVIAAFTFDAYSEKTHPIIFGGAQVRPRSVYVGTGGSATNTGDGDLYVQDGLEADGNAVIGDGNGDIHLVTGSIGLGADATPDARVEVVSVAADSYALIVSSQNASTNLFAVDSINNEVEISVPVGIGDTSPDARLEVVPQSGDTYSLRVSSQDGSTDILAVDDVNQELEVTAKVGIGDSTPDARLEVVPASGDSYALRVSSQNGSTDLLVVDAVLDRVGVLTSAPATTLEVEGSASFGAGVNKSTFSTAGSLTLAADSNSIRWPANTAQATDRSFTYTGAQTTYGNHVLFKSDTSAQANDTKVWQIDDAGEHHYMAVGFGSGAAISTMTVGGNLQMGGYAQLFSRTIAQLVAIPPSVVGQQYFCSDCTLAGGRAVVSTGTSAGNFSDADGSDFE